MAYDFPDGFLWGAATAAHQVEGNNVNSDFWALEHRKGSPFAEPSGDEPRLTVRGLRDRHVIDAPVAELRARWLRPIDDHGSDPVIQHPLNR